MRRIERTFRFTTPEAHEAETVARLAALTGSERVALLQRMRKEGHGAAFGPLARVHRFVGPISLPESQ